MTIWRILPVLSATFALSGCLHLQLFGSISDATINIAELRRPTETLFQARSWNETDAAAFLGTQVWNELTPASKLLWLGVVWTASAVTDDETLYLVTAAGGFDRDADGDGLPDAEPAPVFGQTHAILSGRQIGEFSGKLSPLTEAVYRSLELSLDQLSDAELMAAMDVAAQSMVPDLDNSGAVTYTDLLYWNRLLNAGSYLGDIAAVDTLARAMRDGAPAADLRRLAASVIGVGGNASEQYQLSGSIAVSSVTAVDSDVNDGNGLFVNNSEKQTAQPVLNPLVLGGYVNVARAGESGASWSHGDQDDYFQLDLLQGQRITLVMAEDPRLNDLDLHLFDNAGVEVEASMGFSEVEQLSVPANGIYRVLVTAFEGASNYRLSVGVGESSVAAGQIHLSDDFVADELIAEFDDTSPTLASMPARAAVTGMEVRGGLRRANLLRFGRSRGRALAKLGVSGRVGAGVRRSDIQQRKMETILALKRVRRQQGIKHAQLNYRVQSSAVPNDNYYTDQSWHYEMINLPLAWDRALGEDTIVAVVDTGVLLTHPDLASQLVAGFDFISSPATAGDSDGLDPDPSDPGDSDGTSSSSFHGTHVSGTIAAASDNDSGVAGIAWNAKIMPLRALGIGGGTSYDVMQAVRYAAGLGNDSGTLPARAADVINLSLSGGGFSSLEQSLFDQLAARGVIVVAAAGNESSSDFSYPASYDNVISVSAVNINRGLARYSNFGSRIDIAAPGGDSLTADANGDGVPDMILSTSADDNFSPPLATYELLQGTSMAAPHVAGVAALMKSVYPALTGPEFASLLVQGLLTQDIGSVGRDNNFGHGLINANRAVLAAQALANGGEILQIPSIAVSTASLNFGLTRASRELLVSNAGTGVLQVTGIVTDESWLEVSAKEIDSNGNGSYSVDVDRSQLGNGTFSGQVRIESNGGTRFVQVILQQLDREALGGDAGVHYVLLLNAQSGEVEQEAIVYADRGSYNYQFSNVPAAEYEILAGSDADNDFFICDAGEACGAYPVLDQTPLRINVTSDLSGLNFSTSFNAGIVASSSGVKAAGVRRSRSIRARRTR